MAQPPWDDPSNSDAALKRDIEHWRKDLDAWEAEGLIDTAPVLIIKGWIATVEKLLADRNA